VIDHVDLGGVSNSQFHVSGAKRSEDTPFGKLEIVGVPTNYSHVTDLKIGNGRGVPIPSLEESTLEMARVLVK
jgi:hypothetical protein